MKRSALLILCIMAICFAGCRRNGSWNLGKTDFKAEIFEQDSSAAPVYSYTARTADQRQSISFLFPGQPVTGSYHVADKSITSPGEGQVTILCMTIDTDGIKIWQPVRSSTTLHTVIKDGRVNITLADCPMDNIAYPEPATLLIPDLSWQL